MEKRWDLTEGNKPLLAKEGKFYIAYVQDDGEIRIKDVPVGLPYRWFNPVSGEFLTESAVKQEQKYTAPNKNPWVLIIGEKIY